MLGIMTSRPSTSRMDAWYAASLSRSLLPMSPLMRSHSAWVLSNTLLRCAHSRASAGSVPPVPLVGMPNNVANTSFGSSRGGIG